MKRLLLSTAMLGATALPALAQDQTIFREAPDALEIRASDFMGMRVYASEAAVEGEEFEGVQQGWEDVGEIGDIILDRDGTVQAVLVDIGGFLGIGERTVAVSMDALRFVSDSATAEDVDDFFLVMNASREALEGAPEYVVAQDEGMTAEQAATETDEAIEEGAEDVAAAGAAVEAAAEETGETVAEAAGDVAEGTENAVEETGEEIADAGEEVADEAADAGEEVAEEVDQADMTDEQEDAAEVADEQADTAEEAAEEAAQAGDEMADEAADQAEEAAEQAGTETETAVDATADAAVATTEGEEVASADAPARTPVSREGFVAAGAEDFTADRLQGAAVFDANDERVGEVGEILLSEDGQVSDLIIDVGGFLGLGEKPVALPMDSLDILRQDGGEEIRVYVSQTEEELEAMERYEAQ